jgi:hypothetical protein
MQHPFDIQVYLIYCNRIANIVANVMIFLPTDITNIITLYGVMQPDDHRQLTLQKLLPTYIRHGEYAVNLYSHEHFGWIMIQYNHEHVPLYSFDNLLTTLRSFIHSIDRSIATTLRDKRCIAYLQAAEKIV